MPTPGTRSGSGPGEPQLLWAQSVKREADISPRDRLSVSCLPEPGLLAVLFQISIETHFPYDVLTYKIVLFLWKLESDDFTTRYSLKDITYVWFLLRFNLLSGTSLGPVVRTLHFMAGGVGLIPGRGIKIPQSTRCSQ